MRLLPIGYIDIARGVGGDAPRTTKLSIGRSITAPFGWEGAVSVELLDAGGCPIDYIDITGGVGGDASWVAKLTIGGAITPFS